MSSREIEQHNVERIKVLTGFLKWYRINSGLSQMALSEYSGIHRNTIVRYEASSPENITILTVFEIADAMELDVNQIFLEIE